MSNGLLLMPYVLQEVEMWRFVIDAICVTRGGDVRSSSS
jgi:hypothetical protein